MPGDGDDVAGLGEVDAGALQAAEGQHFGDAPGLDQGAVAAQSLDRLVRPHAAGRDAPREHPAQVGIGLQRRGEQAERAVLDDRRRHVLQHQLEQRHQIGARAGRIGRHPALAAGAVEDGEVELLVGGVEAGEQVEDLVQDGVVALVRPVDLVDDDDRPQPLLERLGDHELGLRQRPLGGVHQHDGAVHHVEDALHLAAEIGVARRVDDVDARVVPVDGRALGENGDAALALQIVAVHGLRFHLLVLAEGARLLEQGIDQRGLAVIDVRDDRDVAKVHAGPLGRCGQPPLHRAGRAALAALHQSVPRVSTARARCASRGLRRASCRHQLDPEIGPSGPEPRLRAASVRRRGLAPRPNRLAPGLGCGVLLGVELGQQGVDARLRRGGALLPLTLDPVGRPAHPRWHR